MPHLPREHHQLSTVMRLVRHEVAEKVRQIRREILPGCPGHHATVLDTKPDQPNDAVAAPRQRPNKLSWTDTKTVDRAWHWNLMARTKHLDPHAAHVVDVRGDRAHRLAWISGHGLRPYFCRQVLDEI